MCLTKALFTNDTQGITKYFKATLSSRRCQYFAKRTHSLTINERKTGRDNEENKTGRDNDENKTVLKPTYGCNTSFKI